MNLKTPSGTTTTLINHLKHHPQFKRFEKMRSAQSGKKARDMNKLEASVLVPGPFRALLKSNSARARLLTKKKALFLATGLHPYSVVEELGFVAIMQAAAPEYQLPSRTTFSRSVVPELYSKEVERIKGELRHHFQNGVQCYLLTTDSWMSRAGDSYISLTCHMLNANFEPHNFNLSCKHMPQGHTAENLKNALLELAAEWDLPQDIPVYTVTDNGRNFVSAVTRTPWHGLQCFGHTLQLCINDAKKQTPHSRCFAPRHEQ